ncbi:MAG: GTP-binding protein [Desulfovibrio sp.]|nr:GTP-binding protein [Desulfovibrio sp.]
MYQFMPPRNEPDNDYCFQKGSAMQEQEMELRNIGIIAHVDAGKTTLSERILYLCKVIAVMGEVANGTAVMDFLPEEQKRGITIGAACISCDWKHCRINLVDTPGHIDFSEEVDRIVRVIDGSVVVFSGVEGVESQSEVVWRTADDHALPRLVFINKLDRPEADFERVLDEIQIRLGVQPLLMTIPTFSGENPATLTGIRNILRLEEDLYDQESRGFRRITSPLQGEALLETRRLRDNLIETLAIHDDEFMKAWIEDRADEELCLTTIRRLAGKGVLVPVFCGAAKKNIGVHALLDGVLSVLPSPRTRIVLAARNRRFEKPEPLAPADPGESVAFVFKVVHSDGKRLLWLRLYKGSIRAGNILRTSGKTATGEPVSLFRLDAEQIHAIEEVGEGDICAVTGPDADTGDTLTLTGKDIYLAPIRNETPVLSQALEVEREEDLPVLETALSRFCDEDPSLAVRVDAETGRVLVSGMGELHLEVIRERLLREYGLSVKAFAPVVLITETITEEVSALHENDLGDRLFLSLSPGEEGCGLSVRHAPLDSRSGENGLQNTDRLSETAHRILSRGALGHGPLTDMSVVIKTLTTTGESSCQTLCLLLEKALEDALSKAKPVSLEPIMRLEIRCPDEMLGKTLNLLKALEAEVFSVLDEGGDRKVSAFAPLADLLDFSTRLRSQTKGLARAFMAFDHAARCPMRGRAE